MHRLFQSQLSKRLFFAGVIGNIVEHYDTALYGFLAPAIAPLFFPNSDPVVSLILTYALMANSIVTKLLGTLCFSYIQRQYDEKTSLFISLSGMACTTFCMGLVPCFDSIGIWAPLSLACIRALQAFFAAGDHAIAPLWILKNQHPNYRSRMNSIYQSSTVFGILLASLTATLCSFYPTSQQSWRWAFLIGAFTGLVGLFIRFGLPNNPEPKHLTLNNTPLLQSLYTNRYGLMRIAFASGVTNLTYAIPFVFLNGFIPQITSISHAEMMSINTMLLVLDMALLPFFGYCADRFGHFQTLLLSSGLLAVTIVPLFGLLPQADLWIVSSVRIWIVLLGLAFLAPLHTWFLQQFEEKNRYLLIGIGYNLGGEFFGKSASAICLWLWYSTQSTLVPALYITSIAILAMVSIVSSKQPSFAVDHELGQEQPTSAAN